MQSGPDEMAAWIGRERANSLVAMDAAKLC